MEYKSSGRTQLLRTLPSTLCTGKHLFARYFQVTWKFKIGKGKKRGLALLFIQSQSHWLLTVKSNSLIASVEQQHAAFLKAQGLLLLKEVGTFKSNMEGRTVLLKTSTDKKGALSVDRTIFTHIYSVPVWGIGHISTVLCNKLQLPQRTLPEHLHSHQYRL